MTLIIILEKIKAILADITKQLSLIFLYFGIPSLCYSLSFYKKDLNSIGINRDLSYITIYILILTLFFILYRKRIVPDFYDFKKNCKKHLKNSWHYYVIGLATMYLFNLIISLYLGLPENESTIRTLFKESPFLYTIIIVFLGPIIEEIMTRAPLKNTFKYKGIYYVLSALIFGLLHVASYIDSNNLIQLLHILPYASLGFSFAIIYEKTNNIWSNIFFHSLHNGIAIILLITFGGI